MAYDPDLPQPPAPQEEMPMYEKKTLAATQNAGLDVSAIAHEARPTITELLKYRKATLEKELSQINNAIAIATEELSQINNAIAIATEEAGAMKLIDAIAKTGCASRL